MGTPEGTRAFAARHQAAVVDDHFRAFDDLTVSSVGLGTYLGAPDAAADRRYEAAVQRALALGINVLDTAINYRHQRSERAVGRAVATSGLPRDEIVIATKGGFLPLDADQPGETRGYLQRTYIGTGLAPADQIVAACHCLAPGYLDDQIERSRRNLGLATIDIYYLHNPEMQLEEVDRATFEARLRAAFEVLERACAEGRIGCYGTATWGGYREPDQLDLARVVALAREVGGDRHRFRVVQLPVNQRMREAAEAPTQAGRTLLEAARDLGVHVMSSASIQQGKLDARAAIAWVRGLAGLDTALVGMGRPEHVEANAAAFRR